MQTERPVCRLAVLPWHGAASSPPCSRGEHRPGPSGKIAPLASRVLSCTPGLLPSSARCA
jgi:hypothetical protein